MNSKSLDSTSRTESGQQNRNIAIISYITPLGLIIAFLLNKDEKAALTTYHIRQSLGLALTGLALSIAGTFPLVGNLIFFVGFLGLLFLWIKGIIHAINGKEEPVPLVGKKYDEWFKIIEN